MCVKSIKIVTYNAICLKPISVTAIKKKHNENQMGIEER